MSLTAFLPTGAPQVLPFIGTPGAATVGHALVWSESPQGFTLAPIAVGPDQFFGVLPVAKGGWGSNTGSFTSPGAITLAAGGTNQNINLNPSGTGAVTFPRGLVDSLQVSSAVTGTGITPVCRIAQQANWGGSANPNYALLVEGYSLLGGFRINAADPVNSLYKAASGSIGFSTTGNNDIIFGSDDGSRRLLTLKGPGNVGIGTTNPSAPLHVGDITDSTSTTTGAVRIDGGLGVAKSLYAAGTAGSKVNFANLPTASTGLNSGDLWRDSNGFLRIV